MTAISGSTRLRVATAVGVFLVCGACGDDSILNTTSSDAKGVVVLDGFIQPGYTLVPDTGAATSRIAVATSAEFDAGGFMLERDTALAVSSRAAGDLLFVTSLSTGTTRRVQMPAASNPGRARLFKGSNGQTLIGVALRDSASIALVTIPQSGAVSSTRIANAGVCPADAFQYDNATWIVDANANCRSNYAVIGDVRIIRVPLSGAARDTITLPGMRGSGAGAIVSGDVAYIVSGGDANFSGFPYTLIASGKLTKVDLKNRRVLSQRDMPANSYGADAKLGADGFLYVAMYEDLATFRNRVVKLRADDLTIVGSTSSNWLSLVDTAGADAGCGSTVADAAGRVRCIVSGAGSATSVIVFDAAGKETRRISAGQGGVDLAVRP
jgi:hypothetical protein